MKWKTWSTKRRLQILLSLIMLFIYAIILAPKEIYYYLAREDQLFENLTAIFFLLNSLAFFLLFFNKHYFKSPSLQSVYSTRSRRYAFLMFALLFFFGFAEEISWGQRIFGFETPESITEVNLQGEFNIHNLQIFGTANQGEGSALMLKKFFSIKNLFVFFFFSYLFLLPLLDRYSAGIRTLSKRLYIPVPQLWMGAFFVGNFLAYHLLRIFTDKDKDPYTSTGLGELQEFNFSIILLLLPFIWFKFPFWINRKIKTY